MKAASRRLQQAFDGGDFKVMTSALAEASGIKTSVPGFTTEDGVIFSIEGRSFFTGELNGKPLGGGFQNLAIGYMQELMIIHEFMHKMGLVGPDDAGHTYTLANGRRVSGSQEISKAIRDNCFH